MGNVSPVSQANPLTELQKTSLFIVRSITSIPSLIGSAYIIQHVIRSPQRRKRTSTRVLLGMSSMDFILSVTFFASNLIAPKGLKTKHAIGSWATCETFGFLLQGARLSSVIYNGSLALYYLLTIRYGMKEREMKRIEGWMHAVPLVIGWSTAIAGLPLTLYNPAPTGCDITSFPFRCPHRVPCLRGNHGYFYRLAFFYFPVWIVFIFLVVAMGMIYHKILKLEKASDQYRHERVTETATQQQPRSPSSTRTVTNIIVTGLSLRKRSTNLQCKVAQRFAGQALLYCVAFAFTWLFGTVATITRVWMGKIYFSIIILNIALSSLQGFWNALIYVRPRYLRYRKMQRQQNQQQQQQQQENGGSRLQLISQAVKQAVVLNAQDDQDDYLDSTTFQRRTEEDGEDNADVGAELQQRGNVVTNAQDDQGDYIIESTTAHQRCSDLTKAVDPNVQEERQDLGNVDEA